MNMSFKKSVFIVLFVTLSIFLNLDMLSLKNPSFTYKDFDDNWYGLTLKYAQHNSCSQGVPVSFMHQDLPNFHSCLFLKVLNVIAPFDDVNVQVKYLMIFGRVATLAIFTSIAFLLTNSLLASLLISTFLLLDPGITNFKLLFSAIDQLIHHDKSISYTRIFRFISPLHYAIPGYLSLLLLLLTSLKKISQRVGFLFLIPCLALLSITPFYVWIPFYSAYVLGLYYFYFIYSPSDNKYHLKHWGGAIVIGSLFSLIYLAGKIGIPGQEEALLRSSFIKGFFSPVFLFHKSFLITLFILAVVVQSHIKSWKFTLLCFFTPFIILNINIFTGFEYQNFHFKDYLAPMIYLAILLLTYKIIKKKNYYLGVVGACTILLAFNYYRIQHNPSEFSQRFSHLSENYDLIDYLKLESNKKIYCSDLYPLIPILTTNKCFYHHLLMTYPIDSQELVEMNAINFYLSETSPEAVQNLTSQKSNTLATYNYGILPEWGAKYTAATRYSNPEAFVLYGKKWKDYYLENKIPLLKKYLPLFDLFIFPNNQHLSDKEFIKIKSFKYYSIYGLNRDS